MSKAPTNPTTSTSQQHLEGLIRSRASRSPAPRNRIQKKGAGEPERPSTSETLSSLPSIAYTHENNDNDNDYSPPPPQSHPGSSTFSPLSIYSPPPPSEPSTKMDSQHQIPSSQIPSFLSVQPPSNQQQHPSPTPSSTSAIATSGSLTDDSASISESGSRGRGGYNSTSTTPDLNNSTSIDGHSPITSTNSRLSIVGGPKLKKYSFQWDEQEHGQGGHGHGGFGLGLGLGGGISEEKESTADDGASILTSKVGSSIMSGKGLGLGGGGGARGFLRNISGGGGGGGGKHSIQEEGDGGDDYLDGKSVLSIKKNRFEGMTGLGGGPSSSSGVGSGSGSGPGVVGPKSTKRPGTSGSGSSKFTLRSAFGGGPNSNVNEGGYPSVGGGPASSSLGSHVHGHGQGRFASGKSKASELISSISGSASFSSLARSDSSSSPTTTRTTKTSASAAAATTAGSSSSSSPISTYTAYTAYTAPPTLPQPSELPPLNSTFLTSSSSNSAIGSASTSTSGPGLTPTKSPNRASRLISSVMSRSSSGQTNASSRSTTTISKPVLQTSSSNGHLVGFPRSDSTNTLSAYPSYAYDESQQGSMTVTPVQQSKSSGSGSRLSRLSSKSPTKKSSTQKEIEEVLAATPPQTIRRSGSRKDLKIEAEVIEALQTPVKHAVPVVPTMPGTVAPLDPLLVGGGKGVAAFGLISLEAARERERIRVQTGMEGSKPEEQPQPQQQLGRSRSKTLGSGKAPRVSADPFVSSISSSSSTSFQPTLSAKPSVDDGLNSTHSARSRTQTVTPKPVQVLGENLGMGEVNIDLSSKATAMATAKQLKGKKSGLLKMFGKSDKAKWDENLMDGDQIVAISAATRIKDAYNASGLGSASTDELSISGASDKSGKRAPNKGLPDIPPPGDNHDHLYPGTTPIVRQPSGGSSVVISQRSSSYSTAPLEDSTETPASLTPNLKLRPISMMFPGISSSPDRVTKRSAFGGMAIVEEQVLGNFPFNARGGSATPPSTNKLGKESLKVPGMGGGPTRSLTSMSSKSSFETGSATSSPNMPYFDDADLDPTMKVAMLQEQILNIRKAWKLQTYELESQIRELKEELVNVTSSDLASLPSSATRKEFGLDGCTTCGCSCGGVDAKAAGVMGRGRVKTGGARGVFGSGSVLERDGLAGV